MWSSLVNLFDESLLSNRRQALCSLIHNLGFTWFLVFTLFSFSYWFFLFNNIHSQFFSHVPMTPQMYISSPDCKLKILPTRFLYLEQTLQIQHYNVDTILSETTQPNLRLFPLTSKTTHSQFLLFLTHSALLSTWPVTFSLFLLTASSFTCLNHLFSKDF